MEFLKVTKACKIKLVVVGEEKNKKSKSKNLEVGSYLQISFSSAKKLYEVDAEKSSSFL